MSGPIDRSGDRPLDGLHGELGLELEALDIYGLRLGKTALVVRAGGGKLGVDPIEAVLNEGRLHIEPQWVRERDGSYRLKFGPSTTLENAVINDEVSHRVLSYAAPVMDGATRVQGRVSVKRVDAEFPLFAKEGTHARVEGDVLFDEVRFMPGPLADELMSLLPNADEDRPLLTLRDPISLRITEGRVYQRGLKIPLTKLGAVALEGSVDFQKNLDLVAKFSLNPPQVADKPVLASILRTAKLEVPIRGTLDNPQVDAQALQERLKAAGSDLLGNSVGIGAEGLLKLLQGIAERRQARMADPNRAAADDPGGTPGNTPGSSPRTPRKEGPETPRSRSTLGSGEWFGSGKSRTETVEGCMNARKVWRLSAMMALVYAVQGSFWPLLAVHLADLGIAGRDRGWIFATLAIGSMVVPLGAGQLVDRMMATQRVLAMVYALGTGLLMVLASGWVHSSGAIFGLFLAYWALTAPAYSLSNALAMRNLDEPGKEFGGVRLWGTAGWMVAGLVGCLAGDGLIGLDASRAGGL